jgi:hypothetical protein
VLVIFFIATLACEAQEDFFKIYSTLCSLYERQPQPPKFPRDVVGDSALHAFLKDTTTAIWRFPRKIKAFRKDSILPVLAKVVNCSLPDISFEDKEGRVWALSDFNDRDIILGYNYLFCFTCLNRIDSTEKIIGHKKLKFIALFLDVYKKDISELKEYSDDVQVGFINSETAQLISLKQTDPYYYLNKNRQIEFFDPVHEYGGNEAWINFLKERLK